MIKTLKKIKDEVSLHQGIAISVDCVIFGFEDSKLKVLLIKSDLNNFSGKYSLLGDLIELKEDLDKAAYRILKERTELTEVYLEQVQCFGKTNRHPAGRVITVAYYSLINVMHHRLKMNNNNLGWYDVKEVSDWAFDHQDIFQTCLNQLKKRVLEHPLGFSLLPKKFSLRELQHLYEAILDTNLDRRNFRKKILSLDYLINTGEMEKDAHHRPGKLYKFDYTKFQTGIKKSGLDINF